MTPFAKLESMHKSAVDAGEILGSAAGGAVGGAAAGAIGGRRLGESLSTRET